MCSKNMLFYEPYFFLILETKQSKPEVFVDTTTDNLKDECSIIHHTDQS